MGDRAAFNFAHASAFHDKGVVALAIVVLPAYLCGRVAGWGFRPISLSCVRSVQAAVCHAVC
ncbi:MAG TPA: hypothetical protein VIS71_12615 [Terrimicrobium sp.]